MKAPFSWPNNSEGIKSRGIAAQLTLTKARSALADFLWIARATSSLPVPVSPVIKTVESVGATLAIRERTTFNGFEAPTISSNIKVCSTSLRSARFSL